MTVPPGEMPPNGVPPEEARKSHYRRYWGHYNRPFAGCGFLWMALLLLLIYVVLSWFFPSLVPSVY